MTRLASIARTAAAIFGRLADQLMGQPAHRPRNDWGMGDLPAPWAEGDLLVLARTPDPETHKRIVAHLDPRPERLEIGSAWYVTGAFSIDEGDGWYFRVAPHGAQVDGGSDRLHVTAPGRWTEAADFMAPFDLIATPDPEGLAERVRLLAAGWPNHHPTRHP